MVDGLSRRQLESGLGFVDLLQIRLQESSSYTATKHRSTLTFCEDWRRRVGISFVPVLPDALIVRDTSTDTIPARHFHHNLLARDDTHMSLRAAVKTVCPARARPPSFRPALSRHSFPMVQSDAYATSAGQTIPVKIVEVGPRDGLQNEKAVIPPEVKVGLINRLGQAGATVIEAGSFVSPKWVPQVCSASSTHLPHVLSTLLKIRPRWLARPRW